MITEYKVLSGWDFDFLQKDVNKYIANGWQPSGGIICAQNSDGYFQTMVKVTPEPKPAESGVYFAVLNGRRELVDYCHYSVLGLTLAKYPDASIFPIPESSLKDLDAILRKVGRP